MWVAGIKAGDGVEEGGVFHEGWSLGVWRNHQNTAVCREIRALDSCSHPHPSALVDRGPRIVFHIRYTAELPISYAWLKARPDTRSTKTLKKNNLQTHWIEQRRVRYNTSIVNWTFVSNFAKGFTLIQKALRLPQKNGRLQAVTCQSAARNECVRAHQRQQKAAPRATRGTGGDPDLAQLRELRPRSPHYITPSPNASQPP